MKTSTRANTQIHKTRLFHFWLPYVRVATEWNSWFQKKKAHLLKLWRQIGTKTHGLFKRKRNKLSLVAWTSTLPIFLVTKSVIKQNHNEWIEIWERYENILSFFFLLWPGKKPWLEPLKENCFSFVMLLDVSWGSVILTICSRCWRRLHGFVAYGEYLRKRAKFIAKIM